MFLRVFRLLLFSALALCCSASAESRFLTPAEIHNIAISAKFVPFIKKKRSLVCRKEQNSTTGELMLVPKKSLKTPGVYSISLLTPVVVADGRSAADEEVKRLKKKLASSKLLALAVRKKIYDKYALAKLKLQYFKTLNQRFSRCHPGNNDSGDNPSPSPSFPPTPAPTFPNGAVVNPIPTPTVTVRPAIPAPTGNAISVRELTGSNSPNHPMQLGRVFKQGDIANYPKAVVNGQAVVTQANVQTRWPDGSVQHAILSFYIPMLAANSTVNIAFINQTQANDSGELTAAEMLDSTWGFEAQMFLRDPSTSATVIASARQAIQNGNFHYWIKGSEATSIIIDDSSVNRSLDIGFDESRSFRPIFHATFFPAIKKVRIRFIGEIANTSALQDMRYDLALTSGFPEASVNKIKSNFTHFARTRWTEERWIGGDPNYIEIDHNIRYLISTKVIPNFDTSVSLTFSRMMSMYQSFLGTDRDIGGTGSWTRRMASPGGRGDIGIFTDWGTMLLFTGRFEMDYMTKRMAELAGSWPMHYREGDPSHVFDRASQISGLGRPISVSGRPTLRLFDNNAFLNSTSAGTSTEDQVHIIKPLSTTPWEPDCSHQPNAFMIPYMLTGDYFYLEQLYFWASWGSFGSAGGQSISWSRGLNGKGGYISDQPRGIAWCSRARAHAAFFAPDGAPEKVYFKALLTDFIAASEGARNITGTALQSNPMWGWGNTIVRDGNGSGDKGLWGVYGLFTRPPPTLRFADGGTAPIVAGHVNGSVRQISLTWQNAFEIAVFGHLKELGYPTQALLTWTAPYLLGQMTTPGYDPYLVAQYYTPTDQSANNQYFSTWLDVQNGWTTEAKNGAYQTFKGYNTDPVHGYSPIVLAASSFIKQEANGTAAWNFLTEQILNDPNAVTAFNSLPKWKILPRP